MCVYLFIVWCTVQVFSVLTQCVYHCDTKQDYDNEQMDGWMEVEDQVLSVRLKALNKRHTAEGFGVNAATTILHCGYGVFS